jgi:hypothetical protein
LNIMFYKALICSLLSFQRSQNDKIPYKKLSLYYF